MPTTDEANDVSEYLELLRESSPLGSTARQIQAEQYDLKTLEKELKQIKEQVAKEKPKKWWQW